MFSTIFIATLLATVAITTAEDKWAWSSSKRNDEPNKNDRIGKSERLEDFQDRYEESTTKKPNQKNPQQDEYFGGSGPGDIGNPNTQRFNYNGIPNNYGGYPNVGGAYPTGVGGYPQGNGYGGIQQGFGGYNPGNGLGRPAIGQFGPNQFGGNNFGGINAGYFPGSASGNGVLVGPGGPTGIVGRPQNYLPNQGGNGVLVGPGGPTGIIGRPQNIFGGGGYGLPFGAAANGFGVPPNGYGSYGQQGFGGLPGPIGGVSGPGGYGGFRGSQGGVVYNNRAKPYAAEFDEYENDIDSSKKVDKSL